MENDQLNLPLDVVERYRLLRKRRDFRLTSTESVRGIRLSGSTLVLHSVKMQLRKNKSRFFLRTGMTLPVLCLLVCSAGCFSPVALSTMETTGNEAPVVLSHFSHGEAEVFVIGKYGAVVAAALRAARSLSLALYDIKVEENEAYFRCYDARKDRVDVLIVRRSETVTSVRYDVGWFGSVGLGRLMLRQIISDLHHS